MRRNDKFGSDLSGPWRLVRTWRTYRRNDTEIASTIFINENGDMTQNSSSVVRENRLMLMIKSIQGIDYCWSMLIIGWTLKEEGGDRASIYQPLPQIDREDPKLSLP